MNGRLRALGAAGVLGLLLTVLAGGTALAGGWATITPDDGSTSVEPKEDEPVVLGFTVLQHGETPAPWEHPTVIAVNAVTGAEIAVAAESTGADGHFAATVTFPEAGLWSWRVELNDLLVDGPATTHLTVLTADGRPPTLDAATVFRIADEAAAAVRRDLGQTFGETISTLERQAEISEANIAALQRLVAKQASTTGATGGAGDGPSSAGSAAQLLAVVVLGALAGAGGALVTLVALRPRLLGRDGDSQPAVPGYVPR